MEKVIFFFFFLLYNFFFIYYNKKKKYIIKEVKKLITELRPQLLNDLGLSAAIEWYVTEFEKNSGIKFFIFFENEEFNFNPDLNISIFRIIQESLTNVARHS